MTCRFGLTFPDISDISVHLWNDLRHLKRLPVILSQTPALLEHVPIMGTVKSASLQQSGSNLLVAAAIMTLAILYMCQTT